MTPIERRLVESSAEIEEGGPGSVLYQHTVLCQTVLPYRDPGEGVRSWERVNGAVHLEVAAGKALHPERGRLVEVGLPFGPKPRLVLAHLNAEALRQRSPVIEVEASLTAFVKRLRLSTDGRTINTIKDQLARLAASHVTLGIIAGGQAITVNTQVVTAFNLWFPKNEAQRVLWPSTVRLSQEYFESLTKHAVPLDDRALAALSHSAMGLDIYAWLAHRLHRIIRGQRAFVPWSALKGQFGAEYGRMDNFKPVFRRALQQVLSQYQGARVELDNQGMTLWASPPPVKGRTAIIVSRFDSGG